MEDGFTYSTRIYQYLFSTMQTVFHRWLGMKNSRHRHKINHQLFMLLIGVRLSRVHVMEIKCKQMYKWTERNLTKVLRTSEHAVLFTFISKYHCIIYEYCDNYLSSYFVEDRVCTGPEQLIKLYAPPVKPTFQLILLTSPPTSFARFINKID